MVKMLTASVEGQRALFRYLLKVMKSHGSHAEVTGLPIALVEIRGQSGGGHEVRKRSRGQEEGREVMEEVTGSRVTGVKAQEGLNRSLSEGNSLLCE